MNQFTPRSSAIPHRMGFRMSAWEIFALLVVFYVIVDTSFNVVLDTGLHSKKLDAKIVILRNAIKHGAVCMDGSAPSYIFRKGHDSGERKWIIFLEGGGWCSSLKQCYGKTKGPRGSSKKLNLTRELEEFGGILSREKSTNPDFYNWNIVYVKYCDGSSFTGYREKPSQIEGKNIFFRGSMILPLVFKSLLEKGLLLATDALLTGCSAGGLAAMLHCSEISAMLRNETRLKCMSDAGLFLDTADMSESRKSSRLQQRFRAIAKLHNSSFPEQCTKRFPPQEKWKCLFPANFLPDIKLPMFFLNSFYDTWQIKNSFLSGSLAGKEKKKWMRCKKHGPQQCSPGQLGSLQRFRNETISAISSFESNPTSGTFLTSCFYHCQSMSDRTWSDPTQNRIPRSDSNSNSNSKSVRESAATAVGNWFFERSNSKLVDCPAPCNPTC